jgi:RNA polymerase sigma factor (sigma-70 family)
MARDAFGSGRSMPLDIAVNDVILQPFLMARDPGESQREIMGLLYEHAEPRMRGIINSRLSSHLNDHERLPDLEDLYSEAKTRLLVYLNELKADHAVPPCKDFRGYVAAIAYNVCNDYLRQTYPARARLHKKIRDMLHSHPNLGMWKPQDESGRDWVCGFERWRGRRSSDNASSWLHLFYENPDIVSEALAAGTDIQAMELDDLLASTFKHIGGPIKVADAVSVVSNIRGVKDRPVASFDIEQFGLGQCLSDSTLRIDSVLEMREPLVRAWRALCELPRDEFKAYLLYARDSASEDLITLFLDAEITTELEVAATLEMRLGHFRHLCLKRLPMDNESIAKEMGIKIERVYKLRCQAAKRLKKLLSAITAKKLVRHR